MPTETTAAVAQHRECPLCGTALDEANPSECPKCDWVDGYRRRQATPIGTQRDTAAMLLSVVPGLGHLYKGHNTMGVLMMIGGALAVFAGAVAATATMGLGLFLIPVYWVAVMLHVYWLEDRRIPAKAKD
jgi:hypothetical protein